jgi:hypothetical protein
LLLQIPNLIFLYTFLTTNTAPSEDLYYYKYQAFDTSLCICITERYDE